MGLSGRVGAGAQDALTQLLADRLAQAQFAEELRRQQVTEADRADRLAMEQERLRMSRGREEREAEAFETAQDERATGKRAVANIGGLLDMPGLDTETLERETLGASLRGGVDVPQPVQRRIDLRKIDEATAQLPPNLRRFSDLRRAGVNVSPSAEMLMTPEERQAAEDADVRRAGRISGAQAAAAAPFRQQTREQLTPGQQFQYTRSLRNDFQRETSAAREIRRAYQQMQAGLDAARKGDMAAGSQAILVTFQKILDPTSVVRESEYARSASGQSAIARLEGAADRIQRGGAGVPVSELEKFATLAEQFMQNQMESAEEARAQIDAVADEFGLDKSLITRDVAPPQNDSTESPYQRYLKRRGGG